MTFRAFAAVGFLFGVVTVTSVVSAQGAPPPAPTIASPAGITSVLKQLGVTPPASSCLSVAAPTGCPSVSKIVVSPTTYGAGASFADAASGSPALLSPQITYSDVCFVKGDPVFLASGNRVSGPAETFCTVPVTYLEIDASLMQGSYASYSQIGYASNHHNSPTRISVAATAACPAGTHQFWSQGLGYAVINGIGYVGINDGQISSLAC